jgi:hypothetical protein
MIHKFHVIHGAMKLVLRIGLVSASCGPGTSFGALNIGCGRGAESRRLRCGLASAARRWGQNWSVTTIWDENRAHCRSQKTLSGILASLGELAVREGRPSHYWTATRDTQTLLLTRAMLRVEAQASGETFHTAANPRKGQPSAVVPASITYHELPVSAQRSFVAFCRSSTWSRERNENVMRRDTSQPNAVESPHWLTHLTRPQ